MIAGPHQVRILCLFGPLPGFGCGCLSFNFRLKYVVCLLMSSVSVDCEML